MKKEDKRKFIKSLLITLNTLCNDCSRIPGNFVAVSPENKLSVIPWGSENLQRLIERILEETEKLYGRIDKQESKEIIKLRQEINYINQEKYNLQEKLDLVRESLYD